MTFTKYCTLTSIFYRLMSGIMKGWMVADQWINNYFKKLSRGWWFFQWIVSVHINSLNICGHVCDVVEVNFLIPCLFSTPAPAPTLQLTTSTTSAASPVPINTHKSHSLNSTESPSTVKAMETPGVTVSKTTLRSTDPITELTSTGTVDPTGGRREDQIPAWVKTGAIVVAIIIAVVIIAALLFCCWDKKKGMFE